MHDFLILLLETTVINTKLLIALEKLWMTELQRTRAIADAAVFNELNLYTNAENISQHS